MKKELVELVADKKIVSIPVLYDSETYLHQTQDPKRDQEQKNMVLFSDKYDNEAD